MRGTWGDSHFLGLVWDTVPGSGFSGLLMHTRGALNGGCSVGTGTEHPPWVTTACRALVLAGPGPPVSACDRLTPSREDGPPFPSPRQSVVPVTLSSLTVSPEDLPLRVVGPSPPSQKPHGALHAPHPDTHTHITHRWYSSVLWFFSWFFFWVGWLKGGRRQSLTEVGRGRLAGPPP